MSGFDDPAIYRSILEALKTGVCVVDRQKKIVFWNDGAERITGYLRHEVMGHSCDQNFLKHCNSESGELCSDECPLSSALRDAKCVEGSGWLHHRDGHRTLVQMWSIPVRDGNGLVIGAVQSFEARHIVPVPDRRDNDLSIYGVVDTVTGVANYAMLHAHLRESLATFLELSVPFGVLCIQLKELDHFRCSYGTEAGNTMLRTLAEILELSVRPTDFVGRWADEKFLVILPNCPAAALDKVRERVRKMVAGCEIDWWGEELHIMAAVKAMRPEAGDTIDLLTARVQQAFEEINAPGRAAAAGGSQAAGS
jgi:diguanylate cyclase (GGDEF)-like protein/PAS domain S-box-containing protein